MQLRGFSGSLGLGDSSTMPSCEVDLFKRLETALHADAQAVLIHLVLPATGKLTNSHECLCPTKLPHPDNRNNAHGARPATESASQVQVQVT